MNIAKKMARLVLAVGVLSTILISTGHAIGVLPPPAKYAEQEYTKAVDTLAAQNISRPHNRQTTAYLASYLGWAGAENLYLHQYNRFGVLLFLLLICVVTVVIVWKDWSSLLVVLLFPVLGQILGLLLVTPLAAGIYAIVNGQVYFNIADQQFDEIHNPEFYGKVGQMIGSEKNQKEVTKVNQLLSDCHAAYESGAYDKALDTCQSAKSELSANSDKKALSEICGVIGNIHEKMGDYINARKDYSKAAFNTQDSSLKISYENDFNRMDDAYVKTFLKEDYNKRKLIVPVDNMQGVDFPEHINVFNMQKTPDIEFGNGQPIANQLYVGHPYVTSKYVPFEDSQYEFMRDRIGEFIELMQALGAKSVEVQSVTTNQKTVNLEKDTETGGKFTSDPSKIAGKLGPLSALVAKILPQEPISAGGTRKTEENKSTSESAFRDLKIKQAFKPQNKPALPKGLIWYPHEPSWQRLFKQRMSGNLLNHTEKISTKNNKVIQDSELSQIGGEVEILLGSMDSNRAKTIKQKLEYQDDVELTLKVSFAPLNTLK
jgi:tetratricopeptide (TPR) repeat protein